MGVGAWNKTWLVATLLLCSSISVESKSAVPNDAVDLTSDHTQKQGDEPLAVKLTTWLNTIEGGFFNAKQEVRPVNENSGGDVFYGIFAKEFIPKGQVLAEIPWDVILTDEESDPSLSKDDYEDAILKCGTVRNLAKEMKQVETLGKYIDDPNSASKYGPYIQYLLDQKPGTLPSAWSNSGITMFMDVLGGQNQRLPPQYAATWLSEDWYDDCNGDPRDEISARAAMVVVMRADDDLLVPVYDMYNHRNGPYYNTKMEIQRDVGYKVIARRNINAGEQIYNSYNMCDNCGGRKDGYGTPEIFRDYGFVESFPQRWNFEDQEFLVDLSETENGDIKVRWGKKPREEDDIEDTKQEIKAELRRLVKNRKMIWKMNFVNGKPYINENEWNAIWEYQSAMVNALTYAHNDIVTDEEEKLPVGEDICTSDGLCGINYFDDLEWAKDTNKYNRQTCDNGPIMQFPDYWMMEGMKTHYQVLNFAFRPGNEDKEPDICMDLEDTVQICSSYRPHYHEFSSHFAARFVDNVKRVVFVGGGDSMMLHEVLKYPSLEKVVGLELDQMVVRKSFKYFHTQAHFDDDRVEWWFGDATKSLLLLPEDYWNSFDLVIIDLSETVMALTVTEELDVFDALALLLNEEGVMVKNEHYMDTMSKSFDYTLQVYLDGNPKICSQCMIFGSNKADFFHKHVVEHGVETLLLPPVDELQDRYDFFHDFRKNNATKAGKCDVSEKKSEASQTKSAGLLHILDAEDVGVELDQKTIEKIIVAAAKAEGYTQVQPSKDDKLASIHETVSLYEQASGMVNVVFKEGYASARVWPEENYVAVDVGVWGSFQEGDKLRQRIGKDLKAKTTSFFRVVVGGMYGSSTWEKDKEIIGPQIVQHRNCDVPEASKDVEADSKAKDIIYEEVINFVGIENTVAAVVCGVEGVDKCSSVDLLEKDPMVGRVIPIWSCPGLTSDLEKLAKCEDQVLASLMGARDAEGEGIQLIVLDESAPREIGQILHSIMEVEYHRDLLLSDREDYMVSLSKKDESEAWRTNLLERYRQEELYDPVKLTKYEISVGGAELELDLFSNDIDTGFKQYKLFEDKLNSRLAEVDTAASAEVVSVTGGMFRFQDDFDPHYYAQKDYPEQPGLDQWAAQKPLGRKTVVQFDKPANGQTIDVQGFVRLIDSALALQDIYQFDTYTDVGDGAVVVSGFAAGSLVAAWDGRGHTDLSIFMHDDSEDIIKGFLNNFTKLANGKFNMGLRDDFPRGTGRVMNFKADLSYAGLDSITERKPYVDL